MVCACIVFCLRTNGQRAAKQRAGSLGGWAVARAGPAGDDSPKGNARSGRSGGPGRVRPGLSARATSLLSFHSFCLYLLSPLWIFEFWGWGPHDKRTQMLADR